VLGKLGQDASSKDVVWSRLRCEMLSLRSSAAPAAHFTFVRDTWRSLVAPHADI